MQNEKRVYEKAFKIEAVRLVETSGKSISQVAKELGIPDSNLARWSRQYGAGGEQAFVGSGHVPAQEEELRRLRRENGVLRQERDILKNQSPSSRTRSRALSVYRGPSRGVRREHDMSDPGRVDQRVVCLEQAPTVCSSTRRWRTDPADCPGLSPASWGLWQPTASGRTTSRGAHLRTPAGHALNATSHLCARPHPKRRGTTHPDAAASGRVAPNLLNREFGAQAPNQKWAADITAIPTREGWLSLAVILDLFSRLVVGWAMAATQNEQVVEQAVRMALGRRHPPKELLHHSDQGSEYTSAAYLAVLASWGIQVSMSRVGNCYDNAVVERFFGTLKRECPMDFVTRQQARSAIFAYIEGYYNPVRRHSILGYVSPVEFEWSKLSLPCSDLLRK